MLATVIVLYLVGAGSALFIAATVVHRAVKHGATFSGFNAFINEALVPKRAWLGFAIIALSIATTTTASILSLFL